MEVLLQIFNNTPEAKKTLIFIGKRPGSKKVPQKSIGFYLKVQKVVKKSAANSGLVIGPENRRSKV